MFKKIDIQNFGSYTNFVWDQSVKDEKGQPTYFKRLNIIYGRNYSGKTTLSRIFEAIQQKKMPTHYENPRFRATLSCGTEIAPENLNDCKYNIQVYNKNFIDENLSFLRRADGDIKAFATVVIGDKNRQLQAEIDQIDLELGLPDNSIIGLYHENSQLQDDLKKKEGIYKNDDNSLSETLTRFASSKIKGLNIYSNNQRFIINYDKIKLKNDISTSDSTIFKSHESESYFLKIIDEPKRKLINNANPNIPKINDFKNKALQILSEEIIQTEKISYFLNNKQLSSWVETGLHFHEKSDEKECHFCNQTISDQRWNALKSHFNESQNDLKKKLEHAKDYFTLNFNSIKDLEIQLHFFRHDHQEKIQNYTTATNLELGKLRKYIAQIIQYIDSRLEKIFTPLFNIEACDFIYDDLTTSIQKINEIIAQHNKSIDDQDAQKNDAKEKLRLLMVKNFVDNTSYRQKIIELESTKQGLEDIKQQQTALTDRINALTQQKEKKMAAMHDESAAAHEINNLLGHYFASNHLSLRTQKINGRNGVNFEILRDGLSAHNLSEGECSLIAFCYFLAKIKDHTNNMIIYIDDPICSLDGNNIFFIFSAIKYVLSKNGIKYKQAFISTHNLEFLKYLTKINYPKDKDGGHAHLMIEKTGSSLIKTTPKHLSKNTSEFIFLFDQIFKCCSTPLQDSDYECAFTLGNNLRRFMEIYFFFKFPCNKNEKIMDFFHSDYISYCIYDRISNEFSHQMGRMEKTMQTVDYIELAKLAKFIVTKIEEKDSDQLESLLESIGESMASWKIIKARTV